MSSLVEITLSIVVTFCLIKSCALFIHTSVPWERPEILTKSENVFGLVSISICLTKSVPNSGIAKVPTSQFISSFVIPKALVV